MRRVVITGMGAVTPIGNDVQSLWRSIKSGRSGIGRITKYDLTDRRVTLAAEVKDLEVEAFIDKREIKKMDKFTQYAIIASQEAVKDAAIDVATIDVHRAGVLISSGIGGLSTIETEHFNGHEKGYDRIMPFFIPMSITNMAAGRVAIEHGFKGMCSCVVTACAGGTSAVGDAFRYIRDGYAEVMLAGGTDASITPLGVGGFTSMKALCQETDPSRASIPFDKERSGFVIGEGAGILCLEEYEHAKKRGALIYGEIVGYGANCDANHITAPLEDGSGAARCMRLAVEDAKITPQFIDYINAHGTSTPLNDKIETAAIKQAFGLHSKNLMVSSTKSMTGHLLGATGAVEAIITVMALKDSYVPATINYRVPDEACDLDIVPNQGRKANIQYAISNSLGFGGHNATIVLKKFEE